MYIFLSFLLESLSKLKWVRIIGKHWKLVVFVNNEILDSSTSWMNTVQIFHVLIFPKFYTYRFTTKHPSKSNARMFDFFCEQKLRVIVKTVGCYWNLCQTFINVKIPFVKLSLFYQISKEIKNLTFFSFLRFEFVFYYFLLLSTVALVI